MAQIGCCLRGAVLSWMIQGAQKFIESDYKISQPEIVKQAIICLNAVKLTEPILKKQVNSIIIIGITA